MLDIYQKILAELSVEPLTFDENGVCTFEIQRAAEEATAPLWSISWLNPTRWRWYSR